MHGKFYSNPALLLIILVTSTFPNNIGDDLLVEKSNAYDYCKYIVSLNGCTENCAEKLHHLSVEDIWLTHERFGHLGSFQQRQWALDYLHSNTSKDDIETVFFYMWEECVPDYMACSAGLEQIPIL
jgi:hypothetical protein